jgi:hypothetical protein
MMSKKKYLWTILRIITVMHIYLLFVVPNKYKCYKSLKIIPPPPPSEQYENIVQIK